VLLIQTNYSYNAGTSELLIQDVAAGTLTPLPALSRWYNAQDKGRSPLDLAVPPDGRWLVFWQTQGITSGGDFMRSYSDTGGGAISVDGQRHLETHAWCRHAPIWQADSRHFEFFPDWDKPALLYDVNAPRGARPQKAGPEMAFGPNPDTWTRGNVPKDWQVESRAVSPKEDRIAVAYYYYVRSPMREMLCQLIPRFGPSDQPYADLWIGGKHGHSWREIGAIPTGYKIDRYPSPITEDLRWTPDGRNLTFIYKNALWTVPAD
jgi:hypothetical protein